MVELFTIGGGDYVVNVLNAVAAWTGSGGYKSLLQVVMVMGLAYALLVVAFNADWRAWLNWFLQATLMYMALMVPRIDVKVTDRINPGLAPAHVANVPLGLGLIAAFTSQIGDYLVVTAETVFGLPGDLNYSRNGMIYGVRLFEATQGLRIRDPEFAANLDEHFRQCVFYDILLGRTSMEALAKADDIWAAIGPGSQARAQRVLRREGSQTTASIETCHEAYTLLSSQWAQMTDTLGRLFGRQLYARDTEDLAKARLWADLPPTYRYLTGVSASASDIFRQSLTLNAMTQAMHGMAGASGTGSVDVYAQTRAALQTRSTYGSIAHAAMTWVPILNVVLTVVFYALFPVLFPLFLMPRSGPTALKGYVTGFFYLAAWGPLYVILHMMLMFKGASEIAAAGAGNGLTLASFEGMSRASEDIGALAGYLIASVPFLAAGMTRGAMAIAHHATSYLNPSQNAAEEAAREASTGNIQLGNASLGNESIQTRQHDQWNQAPSFAQGAGQIRSFGGTGSVTTRFPDAEFLDVPVSKLPFAPQLTKSVATEAAKVASESRVRGDMIANQASDSLANAVVQFRDFRQAFNEERSMSESIGVDDRAVISHGFNEVDQASAMLQNRFSLRSEVADTIASERFLTGSAGLAIGAGRSAGPSYGRVSGSGTAGVSKRWSDSEVKSIARDRARIDEALEQWATNRNWSSTRDAFDRSIVSRSSGQTSSRAAGITENVSRTQSFAREARRHYEEAERLEQLWSVREGSAASGSLNLSDDFLTFARREIAETPLVYRSFDPARADHWSTSDRQIMGERNQLVSRFIARAGAAFRSEIEGHLSGPGPQGIPSPDTTMAIGMRGLVRSGAATMAESLAPGARATEGRANAVRAEVVAAQARGDELINSKQSERMTDLKHSGARDRIPD